MKIKYMGTADRRVILADDTFSGRLQAPIGTTLVWDWANDHIIDSSAYPDLAESVWEQLAVEPGFLDVTDMDPIPYNDAQRLWQGKIDPTDGRFAPGAPDPNVQYNERFPTLLAPPSPDKLGEVPGVPVHVPTPEGDAAPSDQEVDTEAAPE